MPSITLLESPAINSPLESKGCNVLKDNFKHIYGYSSCPISYNDGLKSVKENGVTNIELIYDKNKEIFFDNLEKEDNRTIIIS